MTASSSNSWSMARVKDFFYGPDGPTVTEGVCTLLLGTAFGNEVRLKVFYKSIIPSV